MNKMNRMAFFFFFIIVIDVPKIYADYHGLTSSVFAENYIVLEKDVPLLEQIKETNVQYVIKDDFNLNGKSCEIPKGCKLIFEGGSIDNGVLIGNETKLVASHKEIFKKRLKLGGKWDVESFFPEWFGSGATNDGDDTEAIRRALEYGAGKMVVFSTDKVYSVSDYLPVRSNTEIIINGTIRVCSTVRHGSSFEFFDRFILQPEYEGVSNVYVHGAGTFDANAAALKDSQQTPFRVHHCRNVRIEDITIKNYGMHHAIEIGGSENVVIKNVSFCGAIRNNNYGPSATIQIEDISESGTGGAVPYDGTVSRNITIDGCVFCPSKETGEWYTAVGTIHGRLQGGRKYENITIKNCTFDNIGKSYSYSHRASVVFFDYSHKNLLIENNTFRNCAAGAIGGLADSQDVMIRDNFFFNQGGHIVWINGGRSLRISVNNNFIDAPQYKAPDAANDNDPKAVMFFQSAIDGLSVENNHVIIYDNKEALVFHVPLVYKDYVKSNIRNNKVAGIENLSAYYKSLFESNLDRFSSSGN